MVSQEDGLALYQQMNEFTQDPTSFTQQPQASSGYLFHPQPTQIKPSTFRTHNFNTHKSMLIHLCTLSRSKPIQINHSTLGTFKSIKVESFSPSILKLLQNKLSSFDTLKSIQVKPSNLSILKLVQGKLSTLSTLKSI